MGLLSGALAAVGLLKKPPKPASPLPAVTRDDVRDRAALADELSRRKGGAADILTGSGGAELSGGTGKTRLG